MVFTPYIDVLVTITYKILSETPLRLSDGVKYIYGTVESFTNGVWKQICYQNFRAQDAQVVCRMSGHKHAW